MPDLTQKPFMRLGSGMVELIHGPGIQQGCLKQTSATLPDHQKTPEGVLSTPVISSEEIDSAGKAVRVDIKAVDKSRTRVAGHFLAPQIENHHFFQSVASFDMQLLPPRNWIGPESDAHSYGDLGVLGSGHVKDEQLVPVQRQR